MRRRRLASLLMVLPLAASASASADLRVGVAKVDITPPVGGAMYGYGARGTNVSTGGLPYPRPRNVM